MSRRCLTRTSSLPPFSRSIATFPSAFTPLPLTRSVSGPLCIFHVTGRASEAATSKRGFCFVTAVAGRAATGLLDVKVDVGRSGRGPATAGHVPPLAALLLTEAEVLVEEEMGAIVWRRIVAGLADDEEDAMVCLRDERRMDCRTAGRPPRRVVLMKPTNGGDFSLAVPVAQPGLAGGVESVAPLGAADDATGVGRVVGGPSSLSSSVSAENRSVCCTFAASNAVFSSPPTSLPPPYPASPTSSSSSSIIASPTDCRTDIRRSFVGRVRSRNGDSNRSPICTSAIFHVRRRAFIALLDKPPIGTATSQSAAVGEEGTAVGSWNETRGEDGEALEAE